MAIDEQTRGTMEYQIKGLRERYPTDPMLDAFCFEIEQALGYLTRYTHEDEKLVAKMAATIFAQATGSSLDAAYQKGIALDSDDFEQLAKRSVGAARRILALAKEAGE